MTVKVKKQAHYITVGSKRLPLIATKHPTARRLVVRYDARAEVVKVTLPRYASFTSALEFAESKAWWIEQQLGKKETIAFAPGAVIPLFGEVVMRMSVEEQFTAMVGEIERREAMRRAGEKDVRRK